MTVVYVKLCRLAVTLVGTIVTLLSDVIMLLAFVHVSSTELGSIAEFIVTEQMISCLSPITLLKKPLGWKDNLGAGTTYRMIHKYNKHNYIYS